MYMRAHMFIGVNVRSCIEATKFATGSHEKIRVVDLHARLYHMNSFFLKAIRQALFI